MTISKEEAQQALRDIEGSRLAMREAIRTHRGHLYLWLWGTAFIGIALVNWISGERYWMAGNWISIAGLVATFAIAWAQAQRIRRKPDMRFISVIIAVLGFGYLVWPTLLGAPHNAKSGFGYGLLLWMQVYVIAGIWFRNYWLWIGLGTTALLLTGFLFVPAAFWACAILAGLTLVATGFYVRFGWK
jgi:hypothetical protein